MFSTTNDGRHGTVTNLTPVIRCNSAIAVKIWGQLAVIIRTVGICQRKLVGNRERVE